MKIKLTIELRIFIEWVVDKGILCRKAKKILCTSDISAGKYAISFAEQLCCKQTKL